MKLAAGAQVLSWRTMRRHTLNPPRSPRRDCAVSLGLVGYSNRRHDIMFVSALLPVDQDAWLMPSLPDTRQIVSQSFHFAA